MYLALYRKYRPVTFDDVVGQHVVVKTLKNSIEKKEISHAYMFFGPRGTGKTSIAKLFARSVNCQNTKDGVICDSCEICDVSRETECMDIIEIDAASNNGVDEIRELRNKVNLVPNKLKYKVYIIDEVHMLTTGAFNALLKTLEEPPGHVIFILATTDPQKVPETIISRCQCFNFNRINEMEIVDHLSKISDEEKIKIDADVLKEIARISDGGLRDSLGILDKLKSYTIEGITLDTFNEVNSLVSKSELVRFVELIKKRDIKKIVDYIEKLNSSGKNLIQIMLQLLNHLRNELIQAYTTDTINEVEEYVDLANLINDKLYEIKNAENPKIFIEIMLISYLGKKQIISREIISVEKTDEIAEKQLENKPVTQIVNDPKKDAPEKIEKEVKKEQPKNKKTNQIENIEEIIDIRINNAFAKASKDELVNDQKLFKQLNEYIFDQNIGYLVTNLLDGKLRVSSENIIVVSYDYDSMVDKSLEHIEKYTNVLEDKLKIAKELALISNERWEKEKQLFIENKKSGIEYEVKEEPDKIYIKTSEEENYDEIVDLFDDIIEIE